MSELLIRPMTAAEFGPFRERAIKEYAAEHVRAGDWSADQAEALAAEQTDQLLPRGVDTEGTLLLVAETDGAGVIGMVWVALAVAQSQSAWIFDIEIVPAQRGKGHGRALLEAAEREVRARGGHSIALNVFGGNRVAQGLYKSAGYEISSMHMRKPLA
jgi:ribosomal protein S18 acetylase RimI-like enzyme